MNKKDKDFMATAIMTCIRNNKYKRDLRDRVAQMLPFELNGYSKRKIHSAQHFYIQGEEDEARIQIIKMLDKSNTRL